MRCAALAKFIESNAIATGFGASIVAHTALLIALANTSGGDTAQRASVHQPVQPMVRALPVEIAIAVEVPRETPVEKVLVVATHSEFHVDSTQEFTGKTVHDGATDAHAVDIPPTAPAPSMLTSKRASPSSTLHAFATVSHALRPSFDALRATTSELLRGIDAHITRATAPMRKSFESHARTVSVATSTSSLVSDSAAATRELAINAAEISTATEATSGFVALATVIEVQQPEYPRRSARLGHEGTARVEVRVARDGAIHSTTLVASSGFAALDEAALDAARRARYAPAMRDDRAIESFIVLPFEFRLEKSPKQRNAR